MAEQFRNSWLEGPFAPVDQEVTVYDLKVTGTIPEDLDGRLLRVGPNPVDPENPVTYNWFTGSASATARPSGTGTVSYATTRLPGARDCRPCPARSNSAAGPATWPTT